MGGGVGWLPKIRALWHLYRKGQQVNKVLVRQQYEITEQLRPDKIIHHPKCSYPLLWQIRYQKESILLSAVPYFMYAVKGHPHVGFKSNMGHWLNQLTYRLASYGLIRTIYGAGKTLPDMPAMSRSAIRKALYQQKLVFAVSPVLFKRPERWPAHVQVVGHFHRSEASCWQADEALLHFLAAHERVLFLTFGSMVSRAPKAVSEVLFSVISQLKIPVVVNLAAGGLVELEEYRHDPHFYFVDSIPYGWILPRVYAIVHHGGAGTTQLGLEHGCATLILPHIIDQHAWNALVDQLGAGPGGVAIDKINAKNMRELLEVLWSDPAYKKKASGLGARMKQAAHQSDLVSFLTKGDTLHSPKTGQ